MDSVLYVEKEGEPPGPAQAAFKGLVPGRAYNISVQTMSEDEISTATTSQYRTVPMRPMNVTIERVTSYSFRVSWEPPQGHSEFDKYQVSYGSGKKQALPVTRSKEEQATWWEFRDGLVPGKKYQVVVKTVSGKVASWPANGEVTLSKYY